MIKNWRNPHDRTPDVPDEVIPWLPNIGAGGLLFLAVFLILTGRLVPRKEMEYWRDAFFEQQAQTRELVEAGKVTQDVLRGIEQAIEERQDP